MTFCAEIRNKAVRLTLIFSLLCASLLSMAPESQAAAELKINHAASGAVAAYNICTSEPNGDYLCEDFIVYYGRSWNTRDSNASGPVGAAIEHYKAFIHPDDTATEFLAEVGFAENVSGDYDASRFTFARMGGVALAMNDIDQETGALTPNGRTITLGPFEWTAASSIFVFGNDGPFGFGLPRHYVDRCVTQIENAHERFTAARVTGTIDGVSVDAYGPSYLPWPGIGPADALGAIYNNHFTVIVASHAPDC